MRDAWTMVKGHVVLHWLLRICAFGLIAGTAWVARREGLDDASVTLAVLGAGAA